MCAQKYFILFPFQKEGKYVYAHVTGLGMGVWLFCSEVQRSAYIRAFQEVIQRNAKALDKIKVIDFRYK